MKRQFQREQKENRHVTLLVRYVSGHLIQYIRKFFFFLFFQYRPIATCDPKQQQIHMYAFTAGRQHNEWSHTTWKIE